MSENQEDKKKNPFNVYWIYALVGLTFIGINLFWTGSNEVKIKSQTVFFQLADSSYVCQSFNTY
jgi:hypothetical protein